MLSAFLRATRRPPPLCTLTHLRTASMQAQPQHQKRAGDISDAFTSLSGNSAPPLPPRYAAMKADLIRGNEDAVEASWKRLLVCLEEELAIVREEGSAVVPEIELSDIKGERGEEKRRDFGKELKRRGVGVIRGVVEEKEALAWKEDLLGYIRENPHTKAFPATNPQVFELYWSRAQLLARAHPNLLAAQRFLMSHWHSSSPTALISTDHLVTYADRLRIRQPGDTSFALGPHVDGGSVERWDPLGYGLGGVYNAVFRGTWESLDPWESSSRLPVISDLHNGIGACSAFRMFQGWLSLSHTRAFEGTLKILPLLVPATAYFLLRPFFAPLRAEPSAPGFLSPENWALTRTTDATLHGAVPGHGQELSAALHPHLLSSDKNMPHIPPVRPGDYVAWHCDTIHAVDFSHTGATDSSVLYIPACPLTEGNAAYLARQRETFVSGGVSPDFGAGTGEKEHKGRVGVDELVGVVGGEGARGMGIVEWEDGDVDEGRKGVKELLWRANKILGFYD